MSKKRTLESLIEEARYQADDEIYDSILVSEKWEMVRATRDIHTKTGRAFDNRELTIQRKVSTMSGYRTVWSWKRGLEAHVYATDVKLVEVV